MTIRRWFFPFVAFFLCTLLAAQAQSTPAITLHGTGQDMPRPAQFSEGVVPLWKGSFLVSFRPVTEDHQQPNVFVWDRDGREVVRTTIWPLDAVKVVINDVSTATQSPDIAVAGYAQDRFGVVAFFIAKVDLAGHIASLIQTNPFIPFHVCVAEDGSVWSFGKPNGSEISPSRNPDDKIGLLRQYSFQTGLKARYFTVGDFGSSRTPWTSIPGEWVSLRCGTGRVGLWSGRTQEWVELDSASGDIRRWKWNNPDHLEVSTIAWTNGGDVFGGIVNSSGQRFKAMGIFRLRLDNVNHGASWSLVNDDSGDPDSPITLLIGTDGTNLLHSRKNKAKMFWSKPQ